MNHCLSADDSIFNPLQSCKMDNSGLKSTHWYGYFAGIPKDTKKFNAYLCQECKVQLDKRKIPMLSRANITLACRDPVLNNLTDFEKLLL